MNKRLRQNLINYIRSHYHHIEDTEPDEKVITLALIVRSMKLPETELFTSLDGIWYAEHCINPAGDVDRDHIDFDKFTTAFLEDMRDAEQILACNI